MVMSLIARRRIASSWFCFLSLRSVPFAIWGIYTIGRTFGMGGEMQIGTAQYPFSYPVVAFISLGLLLVPFYVSQFFRLPPGMSVASNLLWIVSLLYNLPFAILALLLLVAVHHGQWRTSQVIFVSVIELAGFLSLVGCVLSAASVDYKFRSDRDYLR
jgi:hypothetical protein